MSIFGEAKSTKDIYNFQEVEISSGRRRHHKPTKWGLVYPYQKWHINVAESYW